MKGITPGDWAIALFAVVSTGGAVVLFYEGIVSFVQDKRRYYLWFLPCLPALILGFYLASLLK